VRELVGRVRNVILMNVYLDLENPGGSGFWAGGYMSQVREMGKLVYEQPGFWEFGGGRVWGRVEKGEVSLQAT
jgi:hypothetical protein